MKHNFHKRFNWSRYTTKYECKSHCLWPGAIPHLEFIIYYEAFTREIDIVTTSTLCILCICTPQFFWIVCYLLRWLSSCSFSLLGHEEIVAKNEQNFPFFDTLRQLGKLHLNKYWNEYIMMFVICHLIFLNQLFYNTIGFGHRMDA